MIARLVFSLVVALKDIVHLILTYIEMEDAVENVHIMPTDN